MDIKEEGNIGKLTLKNRMIMAPIKTSFGEPGGKVTQKQLNFYQSIAQGGVSMIIIEPASVMQNGKEHPKQVCIHSDEHINELKKIVDTIHQQGSRACAHINHAGSVLDKDGKRQNLGKFDLVVFTVGTHSERELWEEIKDKFETVLLAGDAQSPSNAYTVTKKTYELLKEL